MPADVVTPVRDTTLNEGLDLLPLGACVITSELVVRAWNDVLVDWTGISKQQAVGMNLGEQYPHLLEGRYRDRLQQVFQGGNPAVYSAALHKHFIPVVCALGGDARLMIQQTQVRRLPSDPPLALVTIENVTTHYMQLHDLRAGRARAEAANLSKSEFLANMSHEIRTPMTAILGFSELLLDQEMSVDERNDAVATIRRNGEHLLCIINDILDLSKIEAGKLEVECVACSPRELIQEVCSLMQVRADAKGLALEVAFNGPLPTAIQTDPTRFRQILINLVGNAIKFTAQGRVRLEVQVTGDADGHPALQVDVSDSGVGMTIEQMQKLFRPFTQADNSTTRRFGGTGLGLTISKRFANMLGGDISVTSEAGRGSTFRLTVHADTATSVLPDAASGGPPVAIAPSAPLASETALAGVRVLLAEDGPDNQRLIGHLLRKAGALVTIVENGELACGAALEADESGAPFDVVLMDMQMPVLDGYDSTSRLRSAGYRRPIIALTAHAMNSERDRCLAAGCDDFAAKPIDRMQFLATVSRFSEKVEAAQSV